MASRDQTRKFVEWLEAEIDDRKLSKRQAARASGIAHVTLLRMLNEGRLPHLDTFFKIVRWTKADPAVLMRLLGYDVSKPQHAEEDEMALWLAGDRRRKELFTAARQLNRDQIAQVTEFARFVGRQVTSGADEATQRAQ